MVAGNYVSMPDGGKVAGQDQHGCSVQPEFLNSLRSDNGIPIDQNTHTVPRESSVYQHENTSPAEILPVNYPLSTPRQCGDAGQESLRCLSEASLGDSDEQCPHVGGRTRSLFFWLSVAVFVIAFDQISKIWVLGRFYTGEILPLTSFFNLTLVFNPGAAFSFLADAGGWQKWFFLGLALMVSAWVVNTIRREPEHSLQAASLSLIMGGALGNAIDRVAYGAVVDFLDVHWNYLHWPAFNVADSAICVGAVLLVWDQMRRKPSAETTVQPTSPSE